MSSIAITPWRRKPNRPRYYVTDGREPVGTIFERRGVFASIDAANNLVAASTSLHNAVDALITVASS
jgi:hypothetical protein